MTTTGVVGIVIGILLILIGIGLLVLGIIKMRKTLPNAPGWGTVLFLIIFGGVLILIGLIVMVLGIVHHVKYKDVVESIRLT